MKFTLSWLKEHLDTDEPLEKLADKLTMIGLEVEHIDDKAKALSAFTIARVISAEQHPNADRLRVCMVDTGDGAAPVQVVCGAPNARAGLVSVFSPPGTFIPGKNITLGVGTIRGVESRGMLCSAAELQISEDHDGIMELPADAPIGAGYAQWAGLGDPVIEINLTPNRQDCTGVHGIARDLSAADMGKFKDPAIKPIKGEFPCPVNVTVEDAALCPGFALRLVRGVKNGPSPEWLQKRLTSIGLRPINALVDITNFMTYDRARPLHVFDAAKVKGNLTVRHARDGETLLALDGRTYTLDPNVCVIADDHGVESLAGIMGGEASGCSEATTDVLIESALWNEINIAQTGRKLGINSDARYRFERGVDPAFMVPGLEMATRLVMELCGGTPSENIVVGNAFGEDRVIDFPLAEVKRLAAIDVPLAGDEAHPRPSRLHARGQRPGGEGRGAVVAHGRARQGRYRRGNRAHCRRRQGADDAVRSRRCTAQADPDANPVAHPPRQARARRTRHGRSRNLVVHRKAARPNCSAAGSRNWRWPIRSRPICPTCGRVCCRALSRRHRPMPIAAFLISRCSKSDRYSRATSPGINGSQPPAFATALRRPRASGGIGPARRRQTRSTPRPMPSRCWRPPARRCRRLQIVPGGPELAAPRAFRHHPDRPAERAGLFRRAASARAGSARRRRPVDRVRSDPRSHSRRQAEADPRQAGA